MVMLSGLPGVGKSYFAQELAIALDAVLVSVDPIEDAMLRAGLPMSFETGVAAYEVGATVAAMQLRNDHKVIVDAANYVQAGRAVWLKTAELANVPFMAIELVCADSQLHRSRLEGRRRGLQQYPEPTWNDVLRRANEAEEWTCPRLVLDTVDDVSVLVEAALAYLAI